LAGMTGTALTEATEFMKIYELQVVEVPTNRPMIRRDRNDLVYKTKEGKWTAVVREIQERNDKRQPVLVGTISVEVSELLSERLNKARIKHTVLNAKPEHAEREGEIVAEAGQPGEEEPLDSKMLSKQIESAQKKVEEQNFLIRKRVLEYDDVMNQQREIIYKIRDRILEGEDMSGTARAQIRDVIAGLVDQYLVG